MGPLFHVAVSALELISRPSRSRRPEAALAVRHRLNETVAELEQLRKEHAELEVKLAATERELTIAKSDRAFDA